MDKRRALVGGAGLGAGLMYLLDPRLGRRRRAMVRDRLGHAARRWRHRSCLGLQDLVNRARGVAAEARARLRQGPVDDDVLVARVRSEIGHATHHAHAVEVTADEGRVTLRGPVESGEIRAVLARVFAVPGVIGVEHHFSPSEPAGAVTPIQEDDAWRPAVAP